MDVIRKHKHKDEYLQVLVAVNREAKALEALDHPNIVKAYKYMGTEDRKTKELSKLILVMRHMTGPTIASVVEKVGGLKEAAVIHYLKGLVSALKYIVEKGYFHRDIKPANIILQGDKAVFIDFGCSKAEFLIKGPHTKVLATEAYLAPEIRANFIEPTEKSEIYSLGRTAFFMISGVHPDEVREKTQGNFKGYFNECSENLPDYSPLIKKFISQTTLLNPGDRPTLDQLSKLLESPFTPVENSLFTDYNPGTMIPMNISKPEDLKPSSKISSELL